MNIQHIANCHSFYLYDRPDIDCTLTWTDDRETNIMPAEHVTSSHNMFQLCSSIHVGLFHSLTGTIHATCTSTIITASLYTISAQVYVHFLMLEYSILWLLLLTNIIAAAVINRNNSSSNNNNKPTATKVKCYKSTNFKNTSVLKKMPNFFCSILYLYECKTTLI